VYIHTYCIGKDLVSSLEGFFIAMTLLQGLQSSFCQAMENCGEGSKNEILQPYDNWWKLRICLILSTAAALKLVARRLYRKILGFAVAEEPALLNTNFQVLVATYLAYTAYRKKNTLSRGYSSSSPGKKNRPTWDNIL
jgi:hypothetical protein